MTKTKNLNKFKVLMFIVLIAALFTLTVSAVGAALPGDEVVSTADNYNNNTTMDSSPAVTSSNSTSIANKDTVTIPNDSGTADTTEGIIDNTKSPNVMGIVIAIIIAIAVILLIIVLIPKGKKS